MLISWSNIQKVSFTLWLRSIRLGNQAAPFKPSATSSSWWPWGRALNSQNHNVFSTVQWHRVWYLPHSSVGRINWDHVHKCSLNANYPCFLGFPRVSVIKNPPANGGDARDMGSIPGWGRSPGGGNGNTPVFLPGKLHGQRSLADFSPWGHKESGTTGAAQRQASLLPIPDHSWGERGHPAGFWETLQGSVHLLTWNRPQYTSWEPEIVKATRPFQWSAMPSHDLWSSDWSDYDCDRNSIFWLDKNHPRSSSMVKNLHVAILAFAKVLYILNWSDGS